MSIQIWNQFQIKVDLSRRQPEGDARQNSCTLMSAALLRLHMALIAQVLMPAVSLCQQAPGRRRRRPSTQRSLRRRRRRRRRAPLRHAPSPAATAIWHIRPACISGLNIAGVLRCGAPA